jgi:hypothetical protein
VNLFTISAKIANIEKLAQLSNGLEHLIKVFRLERQQIKAPAKLGLDHRPKRVKKGKLLAFNRPGNTPFLPAKNLIEQSGFGDDVYISVYSAV